ncbi:HNH endonuclease [Halobacillus ihumii]|uniref:HNH endonuclease n=1 Tax=Halobacillus ihumii TaxID=2686092 RepID=UPI0013D8146D|nr:hypothetical protein [Halobacillus ihumii]
MKNLSPIEEGLIEVYQAISEKCQGLKKDNLLSEISTINERYQTYLDNRNSLSSIDQIDYTGRVILKNQLISCYSNNVTLNNLKADILTKQDLYYQSKCPFCEINSPGTFDHYLPKEDYPDYSVLALNLIPCCEKCNSKKGKRWKNYDGKRFFLNHYYDFITQEKYLYANIVFNNGIPTVSYEVKPNNRINDDLFEIIQSHYSKLDLCNRFEAQANDEISTWFQETALALQEGVSIEEQKKTLKRKITSNIEKSGKNNWIVALYEAIYQSTEFFSHVEQISQ